MKLASTLFNIGYPVYGARFLNNNTLLVAGGGGEGNNGIPNKLTALQINFKRKKIVKRFRELTLHENDDSPTTLDVAQDVILMGCNENSAKIKSGEPNHHLRKFVYENEHLKFVGAIDLNRSDNPEDYTKLLYMSQDGSVAAIASSVVPTIIRIVNPTNLRETYEVETGNDVKDLHFSSDGKVLAYITSSTLEVISIVTGNFIVRKTDFDSNLSLSKIRFVRDNTILIAASLKNGNGVVLIKISLKKGTTSILKTKVVVKKFKSVTSMDVDPKAELVALAGSDNSIAIIKLKDFSIGTYFKQIHTFAVTRVAFSPDSKLLVSVSAANTVHVVQFPDDYATNSSMFEKLCKLFLNFMLIVVLAVLAQLCYKHGLYLKSYRFLQKRLLGKDNDPDASFFNDIFQPRTTLVGDVVSEVTDTKLVDTEGTTANTENWLSSLDKDTTITSSSTEEFHLTDVDAFDSGNIQNSHDEGQSFDTISKLSDERDWSSPGNRPSMEYQTDLENLDNWETPIVTELESDWALDLGSNLTTISEEAFSEFVDARDYVPEVINASGILTSTFSSDAWDIKSTDELDGYTSELSTTALMVVVDDTIEKRTSSEDSRRSTTGNPAVGANDQAVPVSLPPAETFANTKKDLLTDNAISELLLKGTEESTDIASETLELAAKVFDGKSKIDESETPSRVTREVTIFQRTPSNMIEEHTTTESLNLESPIVSLKTSSFSSVDDEIDEYLLEISDDAPASPSSVSDSDNDLHSDAAEVNQVLVSIPSVSINSNTEYPDDTASTALVEELLEDIFPEPTAGNSIKDDDASDKLSIDVVTVTSFADNLETSEALDTNKCPTKDSSKLVLPDIEEDEEILHTVKHSENTPDKQNEVETNEMIIDDVRGELEFWDEVNEDETYLITEDKLNEEESSDDTIDRYSTKTDFIAEFKNAEVLSTPKITSQCEITTEISDNEVKTHLEVVTVREIIKETVFVTKA
ncbi:HHL076Wp [Eremothecium sinecaudum]|uniref:Guanine nucleotide-exchange factor SEC12 n=1 Tax=Eremothecium sinecaudum TaxID=45286 RepID=A0A0X8HW96_9SACH|nr:HHL076Wp [Eremothecium sinecaudum]AMD22694.1 HHL076Wp [Eremothecium sinecaudum]